MPVLHSHTDLVVPVRDKGGGGAGDGFGGDGDEASEVSCADATGAAAELQWSGVDECARAPTWRARDSCLLVLAGEPAPFALLRYAWRRCARARLCADGGLRYVERANREAVARGTELRGGGAERGREHGHGDRHGAAGERVGRDALDALVPDIVCGDFDSLHDAAAGGDRMAAAAPTAATAAALPDVGDDTKPRYCYDGAHDRSDFEKALARVPAAARRVVVLNAEGGRLDHTLGNLHVLFRECARQAVPAAAADSTASDGREVDAGGRHADDRRVTAAGAADIHHAAPATGAARELVLLSSHSIAFVLRPGTHVICVDPRYEGPHCGLMPLGGPCQVRTQRLRWNIDCEKDDPPLVYGQFVSSSNEMLGSSVPVSTDAPLLWTHSLRHRVRDDASA